MRNSIFARVFLEKSRRGMCLRIAAWYVLLCGLLYAVQDDLIFHAGVMSAEEWSAKAKAQGVELLPVSQALVIQPKVPPKTTVLLFHGNGENAMVRVWAGKRMAEYGHRIVMAEYPGFGAREGTPSRSSIVADGRKVIAQVRALYPGPLQIWGESMGSGPASELAAEEIAAGRPVEKLVLIVPYDKLASVAQRNAPMFPVHLLLKHKFDNAGALKNYPGLVDIVVADQDEVVSTDQGRLLRQHLAHLRGSYAEFHGGHNSWAIFIKPELWRSMLDGRAAGRLGDTPNQLATP